MAESRLSFEERKFFPFLKCVYIFLAPSLYDTTTSGKSSLGTCDSFLVGLSQGGILPSYLLTAWTRVLLEKLVKKFPAFYGTRKFITAFTSARHLFLSWASSIQSIPPHSTSWGSILILSSHLSLGLPNGLFPSGFPNKPCTHLSPPPYALHAPPIHRQEYEINWQKKLNTLFPLFLLTS